VLEFSGFNIGSDVAVAVRLIVPDARFVQPIDGFRRNLCEGHMHLLVSQPSETASVLEASSSKGALTRLVTWSGEFVCSATDSSAGRIAGEISTNADILLPAWETSVCLGLFFGGLRLDAIVVPRPERETACAVERIAGALRIVGVQLTLVDSQRTQPSVMTRGYRRFMATDHEPVAEQTIQRVHAGLA
jgi:hypothetical protein